MSKSKQAEITTEEDAILAKYGSSKSAASAGPVIPNLAINIASEDSEGKEIPVKTFTIQGTGKYSKTIRFRPLVYVNKLIAMRQNDKKEWKNINETIFYNGADLPIDALGGVACGRVLGRAIPDGASAEWLKANKSKAGFYGVLFGLVDFAGEGEPVLVNWRIPSSKAYAMSTLLQDIKKNHGEGSFVQFWINIKLISNPKDKSSPHPVMEMSPDLAHNLGKSGIGPHINTINEFIEAHNARIKSSHERVKAAKKGLTEENKLVNDFCADLEDKSEIEFE